MARELDVPAMVVENGEFDEILRVWIGSDAVVTSEQFNIQHRSLTGRN